MTLNFQNTLIAVSSRKRILFTVTSRQYIERHACTHTLARTHAYTHERTHTHKHTLTYTHTKTPHTQPTLPPPPHTQPTDTRVLSLSLSVSLPLSLCLSLWTFTETRTVPQTPASSARLSVAQHLSPLCPGPDRRRAVMRQPPIVLRLIFLPSCRTHNFQAARDSLFPLPFERPWPRLKLHRQVCGPHRVVA